MQVLKAILFVADVLFAAAIAMDCKKRKDDLSATVLCAIFMVSNAFALIS